LDAGRLKKIDVFFAQDRVKRMRRENPDVAEKLDKIVEERDR
jgi:hypothetical protein